MRTLELDANPLPENRLFGLHMDVAEFKDEETGMEGSVSHNFGMGGASLQIRVEVNGTIVREVIDVRPLIEKWSLDIQAEILAKTQAG